MLTKNYKNLLKKMLKNSNKCRKSKEIQVNLQIQTHRKNQEAKSIVVSLP